jgi:hypothetical protein
MTGRTTPQHMRVYIGGYRISGYTQTIGPLTEEFPELTRDALTDAVGGALPGRAKLSPGTLNGIFDNTATSGLHALMSGSPADIRHLIVAIGDRAAPVQGDICFAGAYHSLAYQATGDDIMAAVLPFAGWDVSASSLLYNKAFGKLLHADGAETAVNSAVGIDELGATAYGGYMVYQVLAGDGTATIKVQHAATNSDGSFGDLSGCTSGSIDCSTPRAGLAAASPTASVSRYTRWQVVLGTATTVTFALAFVRRFGN